MKRIIACVLIMTLIFTLGCANAPTKDRPSVPADRVAETPVDAEAPADTAEAVSDIESELDGLEDLDEDFLSAELENLDSELDFEI